MNDPAEIEILLKAKPSRATAERLIAWADEIQSRVQRGDLSLGILSAEAVERIPQAYERAAEIGEASAWLKLSEYYLRLVPEEIGIPGAESAILQAVAADVEGARFRLAQFRWFYQRETATPAEQEQALQILRELVFEDSQDAHATYFLGMLTTHGFGTAPSPVEGAKLLLAAAALGDADAMFELFIYYSTGTGVAADPNRAWQFLRQAANEGQPRAMYNLGAFYAVGRGIRKSIPKALEWYERAAEAGNSSALVGLATIYAIGDEVEVDLDYARERLNEAEYLGLDVDHLRERFGL